MAKKRNDEVDEPVVTDAPEPAPEPEPKPEPKPDAPVLVDGPALRTVTLQGGGAGDGEWRVSDPIPQTVAVYGQTYDLSDRAAGIYNFRHK